ncbi:MAG: 1-acyl-sn-glycerol-3-phosphate acyltransferase [Alphaproteobacteria bacterium]|nr:1-acyl-sn-glycerol-3-phosphate acyltransferase [Alphaproteobacteria bacterium]MCL2504946.1 1-acyl-sn-glycerol-3-phosphate acyltransferase [Alphaproteobacteria bacterium]
MNILDNKYFRFVWFNSIFYGINIILSIVLMVVLLFPRKVLIKAIHFWLSTVAWVEANLGGITYSVVGKENVPAPPFIAACKHASEWETFKIHLLIDDPAIVVKQELLRLPILGWHIKKSGTIPIDRKAGKTAVQVMLEGARKAVAENRPVFIFPEGTRVGVGESKPYKAGVAALYQELNIPIVPIALNSGLVWSKNTLFKKRGHITVEFLPVIPIGLSKAEMMARLKDSIETATARLVKMGAVKCGVEGCCAHVFPFAGEGVDFHSPTGE